MSIPEAVDRQLAVRVERHWAEDEVVFSRALADSWRAQTFSLADGEVVLDGPGLFVNRALGLGIDAAVGDLELDELERRSAAAGVAAQVEVTGVTRPGLIELLHARGYVESGRTSVLFMRLVDHRPEPMAPTGLTIELVDDVTLPTWRETAAAAWGHDAPDRRSVSDAFANAAHVVDEPGLMLARSDADGRPVGCATLKVRNDMATLGAMSTLPNERKRGVQTALVRHRLDLAARLGADLAVTSVAAGSNSERNLQRLGFTRSHTKVGFERRI